MTNTQPQERTEAGSHNPEFRTSSPLGDWYRDNKGFTWIFLVILVGSLGYNYYAPRTANANQQAAWSAFAEIRATPGGAYTSENISDTLTRARTEKSIHPWVVLSGIQESLATANTDSLRTLIDEANSLKASGALPGLQAPDNGKQVGVFDLAIQRAEEALAGGEARTFSNPEPTGSKVAVTLSDGAETTYVATFGLHEEHAPIACATFLDLVKEGALVGRKINRAGAFGLTFKAAEANANAEGIATETGWGYYHSVGALSFSQKPGAAHLGDPDTLELTIQDAFHLDGRTTVFADLIDGIDEATMESLQFGGPNSEDMLPALEITKAEIL